MSIEEQIKNEQKDMQKQIYDYLKNVIDLEFKSNPAPICSKSGEPNTRNTWERFCDSKGAPELETLLRWLKNAHTRIDLIIPGGYVQKLKGDISLNEDEPFTALWNFQKVQPDKENCLKFAVCDNSMTKYRKTFPKKFAVIAKLFIGMGIKIELRNDDPEVEDVISPSIMPDEVNPEEYQPILQQFWLSHQQ